MHRGELWGRFRSCPSWARAPDPHGFDGNDNDGIGCESG